MMKRGKRALASLLVLLTALAPLFLGAAAEAAADLTGLTTFTFARSTVTVTEGRDSNYEVVVYTSADDSATYAPLAETDENGNTVYSLPSGIPQDVTAELQVGIQKKGGAYVFQGAGTGSIAVKKGATGASVLYLNGLTLTSGFTAPLSVKKDSAATCTVYAVEGTVNTLADSAYNNADTYAENLAGEKAAVALKASSDVTVTGGGTLNIVGAAKNGVKSKGALTVAGDVTLNITALDNGISVETDDLTVSGGTLVITARGGDGIKACADDSETGSIAISGGNFIIDAYGDGIQAMKSLTISGGRFAITTCGGYDNSVYDKDSDAWPSAKGLKASGSYAVTASDGTVTETDATACSLRVTGGLFYLNTAEDALHADGDVFVTGGVFYILAGDDAVHADDTLVLGTDGGGNDDTRVTVAASYEGLEGAEVYIYSGSYDVIASDDGLNAAGGSDSSDDAGDFGGGGFGPGGSSGGGPGRPFSASLSAAGTGSNYSLNISGGNLLVNAEGDGLDSNGALNLTGGDIVVWGQASGGDNAPLDADGSILINGATVFAAGSSQMAESPAGGSQAYIATSSGSGGMGGPGGSSGFNASAGQTISVTANGATVYTVQAVKRVNYALYSSPSLTASSGTISAGGTAGAVTKAACDHAGGYVSLGSTATCSAAGQTVSLCGDCGQRSAATADATGDHAWVFTSTTATCSAAGLDTDTCLICGETMTQDAQSVSHSWDAGTVTTPATCTQAGVRTYTCGVCGATKAQDIPAAGHSFDEATGLCADCDAAAYAVTFQVDSHAAVTVYPTQDTAAQPDAGALHFARDGDAGAIDVSGGGQVNFTVAVDPGYKLAAVTVGPAGNYKALKDPAGTGTDAWRVTKITGPITVTVATVDAARAGAVTDALAWRFDGEAVSLTGTAPENAAVILAAYTAENRLAALTLTGLDAGVPVGADWSRCRVFVLDADHCAPLCAAAEVDLSPLE